MPSDRFARDKATISAELERRARARQTITYGEAAALVGRAKQGRPDLGALVVRMSTGLPSYVGSGADARAKAIAVQEAVFATWA